MKIVCMSIGTRGDMEPFLAVGELLKKAGHKVVCIMPEQFHSLAEASGFGFRTLGPEFMELLESDIGKAAMGGSGTGWQKMKAYYKLAKVFRPLRKELAKRQYELMQAEAPDRLVHHTKTIYGFYWGRQHPGQATLLSPVPYILHPTGQMSHIAFARNWGPYWNKASYSLAGFGLVQSIIAETKSYPGQKKLNSVQVKEVLRNQRSIYTISPALFDRPPEWPLHVHVLGYHERDKTVKWEPSEELKAFVARHPKLMLFTFGSMTNPEPEEKTRIALETLESLGIPAILNTAEGGLVAPDSYNTDRFLFTKTVPYDWLLPHVYAMVHHGGSGTTHMAAKFGCATMIVPHIIDQFLWNRLMAGKGFGPKGPGITQLSVAKLTPLIKDLWENPEYKRNAEAAAAQMAREDFAGELVETITNLKI